MCEGAEHISPFRARMSFWIVNKALRFHDLDKDDLILIVDAIGTVHDEGPNAARSHVHLVNSVRKAFRPPPLRYVMRICPHLPHELSPRIENARRDDFAIGSARRVI